MPRLFDRIRRRVRRDRPLPVILMYHRIAGPSVDPWGLAVHPDRFEAQLAVLRRSRQTLSMSELVERLGRGTLPDNAAALTFDDGYADTFREARPRLAAAGIPATLFLATGFVGQRTEYWWDELARGVLCRVEALECEVMVGGAASRLRLDAAPDAAQRSAGWRASDAPRTEREALYLALWRRLRALSVQERVEAMGRLREALDAPAPEARDLPMTAEEVRALAAGGVFEIGAHTVMHPVLPSLEAAERRREIRASRDACERLTNRAVSGFAYPHGANDADCRAAVRECGLRWACSTESRAVARTDVDWYALPRVAAGDWDAPGFERALGAAST